jgi:glycosyltransferase involved in cell wall biosynthesis
MNILFVSHSSSYGGATNMLLELMGGISKQATLHCVFPSHGKIVEEVEKLGVKVHSNKDIVNTIRQYNIDLVITNTLTITEGILAAIETHTPHIWYVHELFSGSQEVYNLVAKSNTIVAISFAVKKELEKYINHSNIKVILNGIPVKEYPSQRLHEPIVLTAGGICRRKGQMTLLRAAKQVIDIKQEVKFISVGGTWDEQYYKDLSRMRKQLDLTTDNFVFHRFTYDIGTFYKSGSIFALTSEREPFGLVLLEAMRAGLPVVTTDSGGPSEIVEEGKTGYLVPIGDYRITANRILHLLNEPEEADKIGLAGYQRVKEEFNSEKFINNFMKLIEETV